VIDIVDHGFKCLGSCAFHKKNVAGFSQRAEESGLKNFADQGQVILVSLEQVHLLSFIINMESDLRGNVRRLFKKF
jgi:hypothetical protein